MVIVFSTDDINVQGHAGCHCKGMENMRDHLCRELSDLLAF